RGQHVVQRITRRGGGNAFAGCHEGGQQEAQEFVTAVGDDDVVCFHVVQRRQFAAQRQGRGRRVAAQVFHADRRQRSGYRRTGRIGVLVGVELDDIGPVGLFTRGIALHLPYVVAFEIQAILQVPFRQPADRSAG